MLWILLVCGSGRPRLVPNRQFWNFKDITGAVKSKVVFGVTLLAPSG
jgi:hypothetical protein